MALAPAAESDIAEPAERFAAEATSSLFLLFCGEPLRLFLIERGKHLRGRHRQVA
jgi:hypothetical protein